MVRGAARGVAGSETRWTAKAEPYSRDCDRTDRVGDERASARAGAQREDPFGVWLYADGCRGCENHRNCVCPSGSELRIYE